MRNGHAAAGIRVRHEEAKLFKGPETENETIDAITYIKWRNDILYPMRTFWWLFPDGQSKLAFIAKTLESNAYKAVAFGFMDGYGTWTIVDQAWQGFETAFGLKNASAKGHSYIADLIGTQMKGGESLGHVLSIFNAALSTILMGR